MRPPLLTVSGSMVSAPGASFCSSARVPATTTRGRSPSVRRRHSTRIRSPMVCTAGLTRSNGSVSHAGKTTTSAGSRNAHRSSATCWAMVPVGTATTRGDLVVAWVSAARITGLAVSGTARKASPRPRTSCRPGSVRASAARSASACGMVTCR